MGLSKQALSELLGPFPALREALGARWIAIQEKLDPIESPYSLARWLRTPGFYTDLYMIDRVLRELHATPGMAERRRRLRSDPLALKETLTEMYFASWLKSQGVAFDMPAKGADFKVRFPDGGSFAIEVTTPRIAQWTQDLLERLDLVALRTGHSAEVEFNAETLPDSSDSTDVVTNIVREAIPGLTLGLNTTSRDSTNQFMQYYPEYGTSVTWSPSSNPRIAAITTPGPTSPYKLIGRLISAAQKKAYQLPLDQAGALLVGLQNLPLTEVWAFGDAIQREDFPLEWSRMPNQVKHVILYSLELKRIEPFRAICMTNPANTCPEPPGARQFLQALFPVDLKPPPDPA